MAWFSGNNQLPGLQTDISALYVFSGGGGVSPLVVNVAGTSSGRAPMIINMKRFCGHIGVTSCADSGPRKDGTAPFLNGHFNTAQ